MELLKQLRISGLRTESNNLQAACFLKRKLLFSTYMIKKFQVYFLNEAIDFMESLDVKTREKIYYSARKAQVVNDPELFKKLNDLIWEFRTKYNKNYFRLLAFWDKTESDQTLVLATHGFVKTTRKVPESQIKRAEEIRKKYFEQKK